VSPLRMTFATLLEICRDKSDISLTSWMFHWPYKENIYFKKSIVKFTDDTILQHTGDHVLRPHPNDDSFHARGIWRNNILLLLKSYFSICNLLRGFTNHLLIYVNFSHEKKTELTFYVCTRWSLYNLHD
jgi:hypothetical protein